MRARVFPRYFEFSQTFSSVPITYGNTGRNCFLFLNSRWRVRWYIIGRTFPCFPYSYRNTAFSQSKLAFWKYYIYTLRYFKHIRTVYKTTEIRLQTYSMSLQNCLFKMPQKHLPTCFGRWSGRIASGRRKRSCKHTQKRDVTCSS